MQRSDPRRSWRWRIALVAICGSVLPVLSAAWVQSWPGPGPVPSGVHRSAGQGPSAATAAWDPDSWGAIAWDAPRAAAATQAPMTPRRELQLVAIMVRRGRTVAAIEVEGGRLMFLAAGEQAQGVKVVAIESTSAQVEIGGEPRQLELRR